MNTIRSFVEALRCACRGLRMAWRSERNLRIQCVAVLVTAAGAGWLNFSHLEWAVLAVTWGTVLAAELINTAIEGLCDHLHPGKHPAIGRVKDVAAAAVMVSALGSVIVGVVLFCPKLAAMMADF